jgi:putative transposase
MATVRFRLANRNWNDLRRYIANQREHHRRLSFQDEFRALLVKYEIEFDERYMWD